MDVKYRQAALKLKNFLFTGNSSRYLNTNHKQPSCEEYCRIEYIFSNKKLATKKLLIKRTHNLSNFKVIYKFRSEKTFLLPF